MQAEMLASALRRLVYMDTVATSLKGTERWARNDQVEAAATTFKAKEAAYTDDDGNGVGTISAFVRQQKGVPPRQDNVPRLTRSDIWAERRRGRSSTSCSVRTAAWWPAAEAVCCRSG